MQGHAVFNFIYTARLHVYTQHFTLVDFSTVALYSRANETSYHDQDHRNVIFVTVVVIFVVFVPARLPSTL